MFPEIGQQLPEIEKYMTSKNAAFVAGVIFGYGFPDSWINRRGANKKGFMTVVGGVLLTYAWFNLDKDPLARSYFMGYVWGLVGFSMSILVRKRMGQL